MRALHFVYILSCRNDTFYIGHTHDVEKRVAAHKAGRGSRHTQRNLPVSLVAVWSFPSMTEACQAERALKRLSHQQKQKLADFAASLKEP